MLQGLIHRDLKSSNLLLSNGIVKLGDFGISRVLAPHESAAKTMVGTPYYMSPEILKVCLMSVPFSGPRWTGMHAWVTTT